ncbi:MAG: N-acetylmuramoyl-L-alanine amidase [Thermonemataceae bacterium]
MKNWSTAQKNIASNLLETLGYREVREFQADEGLITDGIIGEIQTYPALYKAFLKPVELRFSDFVPSRHVKYQIVLHHSAGWDNARGMFGMWQNDNRGRVATAIGINDDGKVYRGYNEEYWAYHIGVNVQHLEQRSVGVELCNWGALTEKNGRVYSWADVELPKEKVEEVNFRGIKYYEKYTDAEIESLKYWILLNAMRFSIPVAYNHDDLWEVSRKALDGEEGLYTHCSFRQDKTDVSPQKALIAMLKTLEDYTK